MAWTQFMDMHSGGGLKEAWQYIYIEAPLDEAKVIFYNRFGHNPDRVTCTCCGNDYSISEEPTLEEATAFNRGCAFEQNSGEWGGGHYVEHGDPSAKWGCYEYRTLDQYMKSDEAHFIFSADIKPEERKGTIPAQGYVWID